LHLDRGKDAVADLERAVAVSESAVRCFHLAQAQHKVGASSDADQSLRRALELGLSATQLHPLERPALEALQMELQKK
jgi:hypothetical protein